jgi:uncharacterized protein YabN with tetrapyrrole methylase and pyrophosphatase domain
MRHLDIIGIGVGGVSQTTLRANGIIAQAGRVFTLIDSPDLPRYLEALNAKNVLNLLGCYRLGAAPGAVYDTIVRNILEDESEWTRGAFVVEGNPQLYNIPVRRLRSEGARRGWKVAVHPAVSAIDTMLIDLNLAVEEDGLLILDAARMLDRRMSLLPSVGHLILQLAACTQEHFIAPDAQTPAMFEPLRCHLELFFPAIHPFTIIRSAIKDGDSPMLISTTIAELPQHARKIDYFCSGYIAPRRT